jgi:hypothetical protein
MCALFGVIIISLVAVSVQRSFELQECEANVIDFISRLEAKDDMKKKAAAFFKKTAKYYLAKKHFTIKHQLGTLGEKDKIHIKDSMLEKLKTKKEFKECMQ